MKKLVFAMLLCCATIFGAQAQENAMKFNGLVVEYTGDNAAAQQAAEALKAKLPEVAKKFGWVVGREYLQIDQTGEVTFVSGENGAKKTSGQIYAFDQATDGIILAASMEINKTGYDLEATIKMAEDQASANMFFPTQSIINVVMAQMPNVENDALLVEVYNLLSQYPDIKLGMNVTADFGAMY